MGLKDDVAELKAVWGKSSSLTRVLLVVSAFTATGPLTSLSDTVFKWKGVVKDALVFYREHITVPLQELFDRLGLSFSQAEIDAVILLSLIHI